MKSVRTALILLLLMLLFLLFPRSGNHSSTLAGAEQDFKITDTLLQAYAVHNGTFLGGPGRNYYGDAAPEQLEILWRTYLGKGDTRISKEEGVVTWSGAGWTGQPLLVSFKGNTWLIIGAYDHCLKKINAATGEIFWEYRYDDVIKGSGCLWLNRYADDEETRCIILQGSRMGVNNSLNDAVIPSYRAVSLLSGKEVWRYNVKRTASYSRDVDGTALILGDTAYLGLENGTFIVFSPDHSKASFSEGLLQPAIFSSAMLYTPADIARHSGNLVTESSPCLLNGRIYVAAGSGHVYGIDRATAQIVWDYPTGADMDGSPVVTFDKRLLVSIEQQYISGKGGILKLNPALPPEHAAEWFFPTGSFSFGKWEGGVVGSCAVNDAYRDETAPALAAFCGIDGWLYVVQHDKISGNKVAGFDGKTLFDTPRLLFRYKTGPSISTPVFTHNRLILAGYHGLWLFSYDAYMNFRLLAHRNITCEATPVLHAGKIFIASRDGYLYCLGDAN